MRASMKVPRRFLAPWHFADQRLVRFRITREHRRATDPKGERRGSERAVRFKQQIYWFK
jgi:hypothetical protein